MLSMIRMTATEKGTFAFRMYQQLLRWSNPNYRKNNRAYYLKNLPRIKAYSRLYFKSAKGKAAMARCLRKRKLRYPNYERDQRQKAKLLVFQHYGGTNPKCVCCGESTSAFLTFDHTNGGGNKHRRKDPSARHIIYWLKAHNFPTEFQILCWNCQHGKRINGVCPHKKVDAAS